MKHEIINSPAAPEAIGPYSQAVRIGGLLYTAGQVPLDPATKKLVPGGIAEQTRQVLANLRAVLAAAGAGFEDVVKTTVFLQDLGDFAAFNEVYGEVFAGSPPARSTVQVAALPLGARVEIELVAELAE
jgi:2-iminobutanoate/2-iminopropanoate deaminase